MTKENVVEKVRKLLALSQSDNPNEAASAAAMAQQLMEKHAIEMADVEEEPEKVEWSDFGPKLKRKSTWQGFLATVIAENHGCASVWMGSRLVIAGRSSDVQIANAVRDYCHHEIDRLTAKHAAGQGRQYGVSFRIGCVVAIKKAIQQERDALRAAMAGKVTETALTVVDTRAKEAEETFGPTSAFKSNRRQDALGFISGQVHGKNIYAGTKKRVDG